MSAHIAADVVLLYLNNRSTPDGHVSRTRAREWRNAGLASFFDKGRAILVHNVRPLLSVSGRRYRMCKVCGGGTSNTICARCRLDS